MSDIIEIKLSQCRVALIEPIDADLAEVYWCSSGDKKYVVRRDPDKDNTQYLHRIIMERMIGRSLQEGEYVDHANGEGYDNRRKNLRLATNAENNWNKGLQRSNTSGYKGIYLDKRRSKWVARIKVNGQQIWIGEFASKIEAAKQYNIAALKHYGEFAWLNPLPDEATS